MAFSYNKILNLPERCMLEKRLTKAFFLKHFDLSVTEKKLLNNVIVSMDWLASVKPNNSNILAVKNDDYMFEEIQFILCTIPDTQLNQWAEKCNTFIQKNIPYHIVLIVEDHDGFVINTCDKRINQADNSKRTIEQSISTQPLSKLYKTDVVDAFYESLNFSRLDKTNLETTYKSYIQAIVQLQTANITGNYIQRRQSRTQQDMELLTNIESGEKELLRLSKSMKNETQINNKVSLNVEIQKLKQVIKHSKNKLGKA